MGEHLLCKQRVAGSIPVGSTKAKKTPEFVGLFSFSDRQHNIDREKSSHNERFILLVLIYAIPYYNKLALGRALKRTGVLK